MTLPDGGLSWPPTLEMLKLDTDAPAMVSAQQEARLAQTLAASIAFVERARAGQIDFTGDTMGELPMPDADLVLGTIRLAVRWNARRRSVDGLVDMGTQGIGRMPQFDADLERMLRIGKYQGFGVA